MKVLVTGATGFLGNHLTETLVEKGKEVRALVRDMAKAHRLKELGVELCSGDLCDPSSLFSAAQGVEIVYHCAGRVDEWGEKELFYKANVEGTRNLLEAALKNGCKVVHTSSLTVLALHKSPKPIDETFPYAPKVVDFYTETKRKGEKIALEYSQGKGLPVTIVRPGLIWGPGDTKTLPRLIDILKKKRMFLVNGGKNHLTLSYCSNVVDGLILAGQSGASGRVYHITDGEKVTAKDYFCALASLFQLPPPSTPVPFSLALLVVFLMGIQARLTRREDPPLFTLYGLYLLTHDLEVDLSRARTELGYQPKIGFKEGIKLMEEWIKEENVWGKQ
jgi:nucleoside-diphosphate-sugar epimerase